MKIQRTLLPGQPGTKKWIERFGNDLVCVRYRNDLERNEKWITAEIIIERQEKKSEKGRIPINKIMDIRIEYGERELAQKVKSLGGRWDRQNKVWRLSYKYVRILHLEDRIVP